MPQKTINIPTMAEDKNKQNPEELNDEQLDEVSGGSRNMRDKEDSIPPS